MEWRQESAGFYPEVRSERPEDDLSRAVITWLVLGCLLASLAFWMQPTPSPDASSKGLRVRKIEIVDGAGNTRARIGVDVDGIPSLRLYDSAGMRRLELAVRSEGPGVTVFDALGKERLMLVAPPGLLETETLEEDGRLGP